MMTLDFAKKIVLHSEIILPENEEDKFIGPKNGSENLPSMNPSGSEIVSQLAFEVASRAAKGIDISKYPVLGNI